MVVGLDTGCLVAACEFIGNSGKCEWFKLVVRVEALGGLVLNWASCFEFDFWRCVSQDREDW